MSTSREPDAVSQAHEDWQRHKRACGQCERHEIRGLCPAGRAVNARILDAELAVDRALGIGALAEGTRVAYHGSVAALHGAYTAVPCGCGSCGADRHELRDGDEELVAEHVSRSSLTPIPAPGTGQQAGAI